jgi:hypothetical protein
MGSPISTEPRPRVKITGTVRSIRHGRIGGAPALEASIQPANRDRIELVWLGRETISGIEPGQTVAAEGRLSVRRGRATMYNPRYELTPGARTAGQLPLESSSAS